MTVTLVVLASIAAANPLRAAAAAPTDRRGAVGVAVITVVGLVLVAALVSGPLLDAIDVTGPSARIAAGVALVAVGLKDLLAAPPTAEPGLAGRRAGIVPLAFPVIFSPALALLAMAAAADRGVLVAVAATVPAVVLAGLAAAVPPRRTLRPLVGALGAAGAALGALVVLDGVYSI